MNHNIPLLPALLTVLSLSLVTPALADDDGRMLFDFARPDAAQAWQPVNDGVMGGVSDGRFKITRVQADGPKVGAGEWAKSANIAAGARFT